MQGGVLFSARRADDVREQLLHWSGGERRLLGVCDARVSGGDGVTADRQLGSYDAGLLRLL
jgi:hypothetical protein